MYRVVFFVLVLSFFYLIYRDQMKIGHSIWKTYLWISLIMFFPMFGIPFYLIYRLTQRMIINKNVVSGQICTRCGKDNSFSANQCNSCYNGLGVL